MVARRYLLDNPGVDLVDLEWEALNLRRRSSSLVAYSRHLRARSRYLLERSGNAVASVAGMALPLVQLLVADDAGSTD